METNDVLHNLGGLYKRVFHLCMPVMYWKMETYQNVTPFSITARERSWGKVMFFYRCLSVILSRRGCGYLWFHVLSGEWVSLVPSPFWGGYLWESLLVGRYVQRVGSLPLPRHGTWDTMGYGRQSGGMHPTGMLSCF